MARTRRITDEQILEAARSVFLERGLTGTTAEIARRAGISEGSVFRRFPTKEKLFVAALGFPDPSVWLAKLENLAGTGELPDNLERVGHALLAFFDLLLPRMVVILSCPMSLEELMHVEDEPPPLRAIRGLTSYLQEEEALGRLEQGRAEILARTLIAACHHFAFIRHSGLGGLFPMSREDYVVGMVDTLLNGASPNA